MRLEEVVSGRLIDVDEYDVVQCRICEEWFDRGTYRGSYCTLCKYDFNKWRARRVRHMKDNGHHVTVDISVRAFRILYRSGMLEAEGIIMWPYRDGADYPPGAVT